VIVPLRELLSQTSGHYFKWGIAHGMIKSGMQESRAYNVHIVSKQTLERRWTSIKNWPEIILIDECHVNYDFQVNLIKHAPPTTRIIGLSATPERLDGRGLSDIYQDIVFGPTISELVEMGYLTNIKYYAPPLEGLEELHKTGVDVKADELEALFKRRAIYGKVVEHWADGTDRKPTLAYCRDRKQADKWAQTFTDAGFPFENIDGTMNDKKRKALIGALVNGDIYGLTSINLIAYGFDCPKVETIMKLRPTSSKALDSQMNGRGLRTYEEWMINGKIEVNPHVKPAGSELIYKKEHCTALDFVNNIREHGHPFDHHEWNFYGKEKRKKKGASAAILKLCPICWMYYEGTKCSCGNDRPPRKANGMVEIDGRLVEHKGPIPLKDRPYEEKKEFHDRISSAKEAFKASQDVGEIDYGPIEDLCKIADDLGYSAMWVYHQLNNLEHAVNVPLLTAIAKIKGYRSGWVHFKKKGLRNRNGGEG
jgi:superfamily II DNA or RNA helicase